MNEQLTLFGDTPKGGKVFRGVPTIHSKDETIIAGISELYLNGDPFCADVTFSTGEFWKKCGLPTPKLRYDIDPQAEGVTEASMTNLPLEDRSIRSLVCDPPFLVKTGDGYNMKDRFGSYPSMDELLKEYKLAIFEFMRVLKTNGIVAFKCQGMVENQHQNFTPMRVFNFAEEAGFYVQEFMIKASRPKKRKAETQMHAWRNHCIWWALRKP